ncbi:MAG: hypothetical protein R3C20_10095 [Planctomycetaceae bacterium]
MSRLSRAMFLGGILLAAVGYIIAEMVPIQGVMRLRQSFAARARLDTEIGHVAPLGIISKGEALTEFTPGNFQSEICVLQAKQDKLAAELNVMSSKPLEIDEELTRKHQNALAKIELAQATLNNLEPLLKETIRVGLEKHLEREDKVVAIDRYIIDYAATRNQSRSEFDLRLKDYERTATLLAKGALTAKEHQFSRHQAISSSEQLQKLDKTIEQFKAEIEHLNSNGERFDKLIAQQVASLERDISAASSTMSVARSELKSVETSIQQDYFRAQRQRDAEIEMIRAEINEVVAGIRSMQEANTILAPCDGVVVYRSAAPNSVEEHGVVAVMAERDSAEVQFTIPRHFAEMLNQSGGLDVWVEHSVLTSHLKGVITGSEVSPYHSDHAIVSATCQTPMDLFPLLANEELVPVQLTWQPPLLSVPLFQFALLLLAAGSVGIVVTRKSRLHAAASHAETTDQGPFVNSQKTHVTQQLQQLRLDHGDSGVLLQSLGNRLRESILARRVDADLLASAGWAINRYQGKGIRMIRQGFAGNLAEGEDPTGELEHALRDLGQTEGPESSLHEDLTELLRTLQVNRSFRTRESESRTR